MKTPSVSFAGLSIADGGALERRLKIELAKCSKDCEDRPGVKKPRVVTIKLLTTPVLESNGELTIIRTETETEIVGAKLPPFVGKPINAEIKSDGSMVFNELSQSAIGQRTLNPDAFPPVE